VSLLIENSPPTFIAAGQSAGSMLKIMKFTIGNVTPIWNKDLSCNYQRSWTARITAGVLNSDNSKIYIAMSNGVVPSLVMFFFGLQESDGALVTSLHLVDETWMAYDLALHGNYVYGLASCVSYAILYKYDPLTDSFGTFYLSSGRLYKFQISSTSLITGFGILSDNCYISKVYYDLAAEHPDYSVDTGTLTVSILTGETIVTASDTLLALVTNSFTVNSSPTSGTVAYLETTSWVENIVYYSSAQTITVIEKENFSISLEVTCSTTGVAVSYALSSYNSESVPKWISIDLSTGVLTGTAPEVNSSTSYSMYLDSTSTEFTGASQKKLIIQVDPEEPSTFGKFIITVTTILTIIGISASILGSSFSRNSPIGLWVLIDQIQLLILVMVIDDHVPVEVEYYLSQNTFALFNFGFIPILKLPFLLNFSNWLDTEESDEIVAKLEMDYKSTLLNHFSLLIILAIAFLLSLLIRVTPNCKGGKWSNFMGGLKEKSLHFLSCTIYIRSLLEAELGIELSSISEIRDLGHPTASVIFSLAFAFLFLLTYLCLAAIILYYFWKFWGKKMSHKFYFMELFAGIKNTKYARIYPLFTTMRKFLFVFIVAVLRNQPRETIYSLLLVIQIAFLFHALLVRPFEQKADNLAEIWKEAFVLLSIIVFFSFSSEAKWDNGGTKFYFSFLMINSLVIVSILTGN
jgi:hypothetical protein